MLEPTRAPLLAALAALTLFGATSGGAALSVGAGALPLDAGPAWPSDAAEALALAAEVAEIDPVRVQQHLADAHARVGGAPDLASAHQRSASALGVTADAAWAASVPQDLHAPMTRLLDAVTAAAHLRAAAWSDADTTALRALHDAHVASRHTDDRSLITDALSTHDATLQRVDRAAMVAGARLLHAVSLEEAPRLQRSVSQVGGCLVSLDQVVALCGPGDDTLSGTYALVVDLGGNDVHATNAGGAGLGVLWPGTNGLPAALSLDLEGHDTYTGGAQVQASGASAIGVLIDLVGDDSYHSDARFFNFVQGAGNLGGVGLLVDSLGNDHYSTPLGRAGSGATAWDSQGFGILSGIGILVDSTGADGYAGGAMAQGIGDFQAVGMLLDTEGGDTYLATRWSQGFGDGGGIGLLLDTLGNDAYLMSEIQGQGYGLGGAGLLLDVEGNDSYDLVGAGRGATEDGPAWSPVQTVLSLVGLQIPGASAFVDLSGNDRYLGGPGCDGCLWGSGGNGFGLDAA